MSTRSIVLCSFEFFWVCIVFVFSTMILRPNLLWAFWMFGKVFDCIYRENLRIKFLFSRLEARFQVFVFEICDKMGTLLVYVVVATDLIFPLWTCLDHNYISYRVSFSRNAVCHQETLSSRWPHPSIDSLWATPSIIVFLVFVSVLALVHLLLHKLN